MRKFQHKWSSQRTFCNNELVLGTFSHPESPNRWKVGPNLGGSKTQFHWYLKLRRFQQKRLSHKEFHNNKLFLGSVSYLGSQIGWKVGQDLGWSEPQFCWHPQLRKFQQKRVSHREFHNNKLVLGSVSYLGSPNRWKVGRDWSGS